MLIFIYTYALCTLHHLIGRLDHSLFGACILCECTCAPKPAFTSVQQKFNENDKSTHTQQTTNNNNNNNKKRIYPTNIATAITMLFFSQSVAVVVSFFFSLRKKISNYKNIIWKKNVYCRREFTSNLLAYEYEYAYIVHTSSSIKTT